MWVTYCRNINQAWEQYQWERFGGLWQKFSTGRVYRSSQLGGTSGKDGELPGRRKTVEKPPARKLTFLETNSLSSCSPLRITPLSKLSTFLLVCINSDLNHKQTAQRAHQASPSSSRSASGWQRKAQDTWKLPEERARSCYGCFNTCELKMIWKENLVLWPTVQGKK